MPPLCQTPLKKGINPNVRPWTNQPSSIEKQRKFNTDLNLGLIILPEEAV